LAAEEERNGRRMKKVRRKKEEDKGRERTSIRSSSYGPNGRDAKLSKLVNRFVWYGTMWE